MARMAVYVLSLLVLVGAGGCSAARLASKPALTATGPTRHVLPNGIPLIVQEDHGSELTAL